jgi:uncharacterized protein YwqG
MTDIRKWLFGGRTAPPEIDGLGPLPPELWQHADAIKRTVLPYLAVDLEEGAPDEPTGSQLGGMPWWPKGLAFPTGTDGKPLFLLAQINFAETPKLTPFPRKGLLQLFIGADNLFGANFDDLLKPSGFSAIFHEDLKQAVDLKAAPRKLPKGAFLPLETPFDARALTFALDQMPAEPSDYRFEKLLPEIVATDSGVDAYCEFAATAAIRLGGYPSFTQDDPRGAGINATVGDFTLLTLDTTDGIMWGDSGVGQFLMHESDLKRRDFSKVAYNWDCC